MFVNILSDIISKRKCQFLQLNSNLVLASTDCDQITMATRGLDWRALLSQPPAKVVNRSPFSATQQDSEKQTKHPKAAAAPGATQPTKTVEQQPECVVPILVTKHSVRQIPASAK